MNVLLEPVYHFLPCKTTDNWIKAAIDNQALLLIDHAHCEKKAASAAMNLIYHYSQHFDLIEKMSKIVREEMRHFEQVLTLMKQQNIKFETLKPGCYAKQLHKYAKNDHKGRLIDLLIIGAYVEARSCERFALMAEKLDAELSEFYHSLLKAEARHFEIYLDFAKKYSDEPIDERVQLFAKVEQELILSADPVFRFHSGCPL